MATVLKYELILEKTTRCKLKHKDHLWELPGILCYFQVSKVFTRQIRLVVNMLYVHCGHLKKRVYEFGRRLHAAKVLRTKRIDFSQ